MQVVHMFDSKRKPERMMVKYNKLYLLIIVVFLSISPHKGQIIPGQNPIDQQTDIFLIDDSGARETSFVDGSGFVTGSDFGLPPIPFLAIALLMIPMVMMTMMSTVTSETSVAPRPVVPTIVSVTVPTTQAAVQPTPCVPTICPTSYRLLTDQTASPNCYFYSGGTELPWADALKACTLIPGAYLWRPNTRDEANAVINMFGVEWHSYRHHCIPLVMVVVVATQSCRPSLLAHLGNSTVAEKVENQIVEKADGEGGGIVIGVVAIGDGGGRLGDTGATFSCLICCGSIMAAAASYSGI
ncbi:unnamed protein product [Mytilus coruscus]|uniref:C-type lectin domain-containing protein n=1 Tax=Mytilus coruscus TaxID=42192 RepID=A0A6J8AAH1_MYTCO|nr:unnamed protein product [Mytilus coruscus]